MGGSKPVHKYHLSAYELRKGSASVEKGQHNGWDFQKQSFQNSAEEPVRNNGWAEAW